MSACVLPIAPEFQDPPAAANYSPLILDSNPQIGSVVVAANPMMVPPFTVFVSDPNVGDDLHVRWLADFPPFTMNTRDMVLDDHFTHSSNGVPLNAMSEVTPSCSAHNLAKIPQHQIMAVVADRPFDNTQVGPNADLTKLSDPNGRKVVATWTLTLGCP
jgi:hypothetical protein